MFCLSDFEVHAQKVLDKSVWHYYSSGADLEQSLRDNIQAFQRYRLCPRVLRDVSNVDMRTCLLGEEVAFPIGLSPTAMQQMAHPDGELATARAAASMGTCMVLSSFSTISMEDVAQASGSGLRWFQMYVFKDRELTRNLVLRAERAGYKALVITVDQPILGKKLASLRNKFKIPHGLSLANFANTSGESDAVAAMKCHSQGGLNSTPVIAVFDPSLTWDAIDWLREITKLPIVLKGILTAEDAEEAVRHGVQGIIVSNHGGRQLDGVPATIDALGEVVDAVQGRVEVYMDGGVRQGTDVLKALAMGAKAVFIGRPVVWGLACKGEEGVAEVIKLLRDELLTAMMLSGCRKVSEIGHGVVVHK